MQKKYGVSGHGRSRERQVMNEVGRSRMQKKYGEAGCRRSREYQDMKEVGRDRS